MQSLNLRWKKMSSSWGDWSVPRVTHQLHFRNSDMTNRAIVPLCRELFPLGSRVQTFVRLLYNIVKWTLKEQARHIAQKKSHDTFNCDEQVFWCLQATKICCRWASNLGSCKEGEGWSAQTVHSFSSLIKCCCLVRKCTNLGRFWFISHQQFIEQSRFGHLQTSLSWRQIVPARRKMVPHVSYCCNIFTLQEYSLLFHGWLFISACQLIHKQVKSGTVPQAIHSILWVYEHIFLSAGSSLPPPLMMPFLYHHLLVPVWRYQNTVMSNSSTIASLPL